MNLRRKIVAAIIAGGSIGLTLSSAVADVEQVIRYETQTERYPTKIEDDQSLPPGVPGVTEENNSDMRAAEVAAVQQALIADGYDTGRSDGRMDNDTRAAIREFQKDNSFVVTGTIDAETAQVLGLGRRG